MYTPDNNLIENAIRTFVMGRKNRLFLILHVVLDQALLFTA